MYDINYAIHIRLPLIYYVSNAINVIIIKYNTYIGLMGIDLIIVIIIKHNTHYARIKSKANKCLWLSFTFDIIKWPNVAWFCLCVKTAVRNDVRPVRDNNVAS